MPLKARDVKGSLTTKFGLAPYTKGRDPDHEWLAVDVAGAGKIAVMFSHADKDLGDVLLSKICRQLRVARPYLNGMISCTNSRAAYLQKLVDDTKAAKR